MSPNRSSTTLILQSDRLELRLDLLGRLAAAVFVILGSANLDLQGNALAALLIGQPALAVGVGLAGRDAQLGQLGERRGGVGLGRDFLEHLRRSGPAKDGRDRPVERLGVALEDAADEGVPVDGVGQSAAKLDLLEQLHAPGECLAPRGLGVLIDPEEQAPAPRPRSSTSKLGSWLNRSASIGPTSR